MNQRLAGRATTLSLVERVVTVEEHDRANELRFNSIDARLKTIETDLGTVLSVLTQAKGIRWLLTCLLGFAGVTAGTVTATIAAIRYFTGH